MSNTIQNVYPISDLPLFFSQRDLESAQQKREAKLASLQTLPHSSAKITLVFAIGIILTLGGVFCTLHYGGILGGNISIPGTTRGAFDIVLGLGFVIAAIRLIKQNDTKQLKNSEKFSKYQNEAEEAYNEILLEKANETIPHLLNKNELFILFDEQYFRVYVSSQIGQLKERSYIPIHAEVDVDQYAVLSKRSFSYEVDHNFPKCLLNERKILTKEELIERKEEKVEVKIPAQKQKIITKNGIVELAIEPNKLPQFCKVPALSKFQSAWAISLFAPLFASDNPKDFRWDFKNFPLTDNELSNYLDELIGMAKKAKDEKILNFLVDNLCAMEKPPEIVVTLLALARKNNLTRLEESCFYSLLQSDISPKDWDTIVFYCDTSKLLLRVPSRIRMSQINIPNLTSKRMSLANVSNLTKALDVFDFSYVEKIICDKNFSSLKDTLQHFASKLTGLKHISVRQDLAIDKISQQDVEEFILFCEENLPYLQVVDFIKSSEDIKLNKFKSKGFFLPDKQTPIIVQKGAIVDDLLTKYKIKLPSL